MSRFSIFLFSFLLLTVFSEDCSNFNGEHGCSGSSIVNPSSWGDRWFQTPPRDTSEWLPTYQDYSLLTGYARVVYSADRTQATVIPYTNVNTVKVSNYKILFQYNGETLTESTSYPVTKANSSPVQVTAVLQDASSSKTLATLVMEPVEFLWNHPTVTQPSNYKNGQKGAVVELFGWPYADIEKECVLIGKMGYLGVKVFPPNEFVENTAWAENGELNPWWYMYQPVSYKFNNRYGTRAQLQSMINTCRQNNVRVYADAVVNHMTGCGNDKFPDHRTGSSTSCSHWAAKNSTAGSPYYTHCYQYENVSYTGLRPGTEFPAVPYGPLHFHCERSLNSWTDPLILNAGWLSGLCDLNSEDDYVRQRIADYFTDLLGMGFSGFRIDAAKHISPTNLAQILLKFKKNLGGGELPDDWISYLEVIIGGEKDLLMCGSTDYSYGQNFETIMKSAGLSANDVAKVKIWSSDYPKEFPICGSWVIPSEREVAQNECHDDQFPGSSSRDMGDSGSILVKEKDVAKHRNFEKLLFSRTDGNWQIKALLSGYTFMETAGAYAPPDGVSDCSKCQNSTSFGICTKSMAYSAAYNPDECGYSVYVNGAWQQGVYTRVHRDIQIVNAMRAWMGLGSVKSADVGLPSKCDSVSLGEKFLGMEE